LALPDVLRTISYEEKRELYRFKHAHNERDWEEEMLRRSDLLARKIDMERLKRMSSKGAAPAAAVAKGAAKKPEVKVRKLDVEGDWPSLLCRLAGYCSARVVHDFDYTFDTARDYLHSSRSASVSDTGPHQRPAESAEL
jgi:hypothetical protein